MRTFDKVIRRALKAISKGVDRKTAIQHAFDLHNKQTGSYVLGTEWEHVETEIELECCYAYVVFTNTEGDNYKQVMRFPIEDTYEVQAECDKARDLLRRADLNPDSVKFSFDWPKGQDFEDVTTMTTLGLLEYIDTWVEESTKED